METRNRSLEPLKTSQPCSWLSLVEAQTLMVRGLTLGVALMVACAISGCADQPESGALSGSSHTSDRDATYLPADLRADSTGSGSELEQAPLNLSLSAAQRAEYYQILDGIHQEVSDSVTRDQAEHRGAADPTESCDRCGRETGFLPIPDLFLTQFIPVEMKLITIGLISWIFDDEEVEEMIATILGDEADPEVNSEANLYYQLTLVRVDLSALSEAQRALASAGELLDSGDVEAVSVTSLTTTEAEAAISFEHGLSYVLSVSLIEENTKLTSPLSDPLMIYCPSARSAEMNSMDSETPAPVLSAGCVQILPLEQIDE